MARRKGAEAEDRAAAFLTRQGFEVLQRNYTVRGGEIDLVAREREWIVFVEVKERTSYAYAAPREAVTKEKQRRIGKAALLWLQEHDGQDAPVRFDIVEISGETATLLRAAFAFEAE